MRLGLLLLTVVLLVANGFFVAVEFAVIASRRAKLETLAAEGRLTARLALQANRALSLQLAGAQLGITMASLGLGAVAEPAIAHLLETGVEWLVDVPEGLLHTIAVVVALTLVTFLHMVVGEMVPKNIAIAAPERALVTLAVPNYIYMTAFRPIIVALNAISNAVVRLFGIEPRDELAAAHTLGDIAVMLAVSREEGVIEDLAHDLLSGAIDFGEKPVASVMTSRDRVVYVRRDATVAEAERIAVESGLSRLPVVGDSLDSVIGFVHAKDLLLLGPDAQDRPVPQSRIRPMLVVPAARALDDVLVAMRRARTHVGLVVDGSGRTLGFVTLEDVLEHLVGDIRDESDPTAPAR